MYVDFIINKQKYQYGFSPINLPLDLSNIMHIKKYKYCDIYKIIHLMLLNDIPTELILITLKYICY